jgi:hypothetical protein
VVERKIRRAGPAFQPPCPPPTHFPTKHSLLLHPPPPARPAQSRGRGGRPGRNLAGRRGWRAHSRRGARRRRVGAARRVAHAAGAEFARGRPP